MSYEPKQVKLLYPTQTVTFSPSGSTEDLLKLVNSILKHGEENGIAYEVIHFGSDVYLTPKK